MKRLIWVGSVWLASALVLAFASTKAPQAAPEESVWIKRGDGSTSCEPGSGKSLSSDATDLRKSEISVLEEKKGHDGKMRIELCGIATGAENVFRIKKSDLPKALSLGYQVLSQK